MTFQQDNSKIHTADLVSRRISELGWKTFKWPPHSCDFSPIEFFWAILVSELDKYWRPRNVAIEWIWPKVTRPEVIQNCFDRALTNMMLSHAEGGDNVYHRDRADVRRKNRV